MPDLLTTWSCSLHQPFRLLPIENVSRNLAPFLESDGLTRDEILAKLPYDVARAGTGGSTSSGPDPKRYRDGRQVYQTIGLLYEDGDRRVHVTELGGTTHRWLRLINPNNCVILARHAAYALAACQLRNPTQAGRRHAPLMQVFPFQFIWRAMLSLEGKISSDELNRGIFKVRNEDHLQETIAAIAEARRRNDVTLLGTEVVSEAHQNDRIIPWLCLASFGWTLFPDKRGGTDSDFYELIPRTLHIITEASRIRRKHRDFTSTQEYVEHISRCAALPKDVR